MVPNALWPAPMAEMPLAHTLAWRMAEKRATAPRARPAPRTAQAVNMSMLLLTSGLRMKNPTNP